MSVVRKSCSTCGHQQMHSVWRKREDTDQWYSFDGYRCHSPRAKDNYRADKTGGVPIGKFCWDCAGRHWVPNPEITA